MAHEFLYSLALNNGMVTGGSFAPIAASDLPASGVVAGEYTVPTVRVDQYGRVVTITSGALVVGTTPVSAGSAGAVLLHAATNTLTEATPGLAGLCGLAFDDAGTLGPLAAGSTLYVGANNGRGSGRVALWDDNGSAYGEFHFDNAWSFAADIVTTGSFQAGSGIFSGSVQVLLPSDQIGLQVQASAAQTNHLQEWLDSSGNVLSYVNSAGRVHTPYLVLLGASPVVEIAPSGNSITRNGATGLVSFNCQSFSGAGFEFNNASGAAGTVPLAVRANASQSGDLQEWQDSSANVLAAVKKNGAVQPAHLADASAANDTIYYSTTANKLVYKDGAGVVQNLY